MNRDVQAAREIIAAVELADVRLVEATCRSTVRSATEVAKPEFQIAPSAKVSSKTKDGGFYVRATLDFKVLSVEDDQSNVALSIRVVYELKYNLPKKLHPPLKALQAFARINGIYNAWPYFREFVQTTSQRMDLPAVVLPVYRIPRPVQKREPLQPSPANDNGKGESSSERSES